MSGTAAAVPMPARPVLCASVAVLREGRVLLARRGQAPLLGLYSLPGGRVERGETLGEAALRELREEVAVEADLLGFNRHVEVIERDGAAVTLHFVIASFVACWRSGDGTVGPEATAVTWATRDEAAALPITDGLLPVLDGAFAMADAMSHPAGRP